MVDFLVSVKVGGLKEHLLRRTGISVLILHLDASVKLLGVDLLGTHFAILYRLPFHLVLLLEIALSLQVPVRAHALESVRLIDVARSVWTSFMVQESVRMGRFSTETSSGHKF